MGMGEPLYNFENVRDAMTRSPWTPKEFPCRAVGSLCRRAAWCRKSRATAEEIGCLLAISFHATTDETRDVLVPINKRWNIEELLQALASYPNVSNSERITFEYVMLDGVNDSDEDAHRLIDHIKRHKIPAKINLIPFNEWPGAPYKTQLEQSYPGLCEYHLPGRLCLTHPQDARRGYHGGLWSVEISNRAYAQIA